MSDFSKWDWENLNIGRAVSKFDKGIAVCDDDYRRLITLPNIEISDEDIESLIASINIARRVAFEEGVESKMNQIRDCLGLKEVE